MYNAQRIPWLTHVYSDNPRPFTLVEERSALELQFPRIVEDMIRLWNTPMIMRYVDNLVMDWRGNRNGFPPEVVDDIMMLNGVLFNLTLKKERFFPRATDSDFFFDNSKGKHPKSRRPAPPPKLTTLMRITKLFRKH